MIAAIGWAMGVTLGALALGLIVLAVLSYPNAKVSDAERYPRRPRCSRSGECLLDDGHAGDCDEEPYT